jgi:hypothetical protein
MRVRDLVLVCLGQGQWKSWDTIRCMDGDARALFSEICKILFSCVGGVSRAYGDVSLKTK